MIHGLFAVSRPCLQYRDSIYETPRFTVLEITFQRYGDGRLGRQPIRPGWRVRSDESWVARRGYNRIRSHALQLLPDGFWARAGGLPSCAHDVLDRHRTKYSVMRRFVLFCSVSDDKVDNKTRTNVEEKRCYVNECETEADFFKISAFVLITIYHA